MNIGSLLEQSSETNRIVAFYKALKSVGHMDDKSLRGEYRRDGLYETDYASVDELTYHESFINDLDETDCGPEVDTSDDDCWMDDLDEAA